MSEIDLSLVELFNAHVESLLAFFLAFVSATSAFLVVAHLAAREFSPPLAKVSLALYSVVTLVLVGIAQRQAEVLVGIRSQMGQSLGWHPAVYEPTWILPTAFRSMVVVMVLIFASAFGYFVYVRRGSD